MKTVIVEDSDLIQTHLLRLLGQQPRIEVVGVATEEEQAIALILSSQADAVLLDLCLSPGSGVRVLERIREAGCGARVLVLTHNTGRALRMVCEQLGVAGFYNKSTEIETCLTRLFSWLPPLPDNEPLRLQQLHSVQLLDTEAQEAFGNLTQLATEIADVPIALISLVDENRQWFLSHTGTDAQETSRSIAFCAHTILQSEMMEIPDAHLDARFRDNPLVIGSPQIRFYAGLPLVLPSGEALGTLCVIDSQPRTLTERQRRALKTLASSALAEIELRRRIIYLEQEAERRRTAEAHILHLATRDPLTGLPNRTTFRDRLDHMVRLAMRQQSTLGVLFIDLDHFKPVNDTLGHEVGDEALVIVAERLSHCLRGSDTVARLGGDEFGVVLPDVSNKVEALHVAGKIISALQERFAAKGHALHLSASVGVAIFPEHGSVGDELLRHADLAMYQAKQNGGSQTALYSRELSDQAEAMQALDGDLREALRRRELFLLYQPQLHLGSRQVCGVEALVRWQHPHYGVLGPDHFIGLAEGRGFIHELTRLVLDMGLSQLKRWDAAGLQVPRIAINVSPVEIRPGFAADIRSALAAHGVAAHRLELEITESTLTSDGVETLRMLDELRGLGISIAVDDFGVGYSSLGQLHRLPIDTLKIDRSFVQGIERCGSNTAIVEAVVTMSRALGLRTVAEGVEDADQLAVLEQLGCDCAQGYHLSHPLPADEAGTWLESACCCQQPDCHDKARRQMVLRGAGHDGQRLAAGC